MRTKDYIFLLSEDVAYKNYFEELIRRESYTIIIVSKNDLMIKIYSLKPKTILIDVDSFEADTLQFIQDVMELEYIPMLFFYKNEITLQKKNILSNSISMKLDSLLQVMYYMIPQAVTFKGFYNQLMESYETIDLINEEMKNIVEKHMHDQQIQTIDIVELIVTYVFYKNLSLRNKPNNLWVMFKDANNNYKAIVFSTNSQSSVDYIDGIGLNDFQFDILAPNGFYKNYNKNELSDIDSIDEALPDKLKMKYKSISSFAGYSIDDITVIGINYTDAASNYEVALLKAIATNVHFIEQVRKQVKEIKNAFIYTTDALARAAEAHDDMTGYHIQRVKTFSRMLAEEMGLHQLFVEEIYQAAQMHDVGKLYIDKCILTKPDKLSESEFEEIKKHTNYGEKIIGSSDYLKMSAEVAKYHHERYDGTGYPEGIKGEEIPIAARIVFLADIYDALRSTRYYKPSFSHEKAFHIITKGDGRVEPKHFDPEVLKAFINIHEKMDRVYNKYC